MEMSVPDQQPGGGLAAPGLLAPHTGLNGYRGDTAPALGTQGMSDARGRTRGLCDHSAMGFLALG